MGPDKSRRLPDVWIPESWKDSGGVRCKPAYCRNSCPLGRYVGTGFCPDYKPEVPKIAILIAHPLRDDIVSGRPLSSDSWREFLFDPCGISPEDVFVCSVIRCLPVKRGADGVYPSGTVRYRAEAACRHWDESHGQEATPGGIAAYRPDLFVATFGLDQIMKVKAFLRLAQEDIKKALAFSSLGYRPMVLMGQEAFDLVFPRHGSSIRAWRGHWWLGEWPFLKSLPKTGFIAV